MKKNRLVLTIFKKDILQDNYMDSDNCPLTKAYRRAGKNWTDEGIDINTRCSDIVITYKENKSYKKLVDTLIAMYMSFSKDRQSNSNNPQKKLPVKRFTHTLIY